MVVLLKGRVYDPGQSGRTEFHRVQKKTDYQRRLLNHDL